MSCMRRRLARGALVLAMVSVVAADNTACSGTGMDWYTQMVGETPCTTYQKLRQICNSQFTVGTMNVNTPPDFCTDQVSTCCCNTVSFALSMLCLNCQQNISTTSGYDAGVGAYQLYLNGSITSTQSCANPVSQGLPKDIQAAVCNEKIKINNDIYTNGWGDGSWFYVFTRDTIIKDNIVANNNSFTKCASTTINGTSSSAGGSSSFTGSSTSSGTSPSSSSSATAAASSSSSLAGGAIAGIAIGALIALVGLAGMIWLVRKRGRRTGAGILDEPLGGGGGRGSGSMAMATVDDSLIARGYTYTSPSSETGGGTTHPSSSGYFDGAGHSGASEASGPGFAGLGAASAYNPYNADSRSTTTGQASSHRGEHTTQPSTSSMQTSNAYGGVAASVSGSSSSGGGPPLAPVRREAGPLPRKNRGGPTPPTIVEGTRAASEEPFLETDEREPWQLVDERHTDAGPVGLSLGRSASGRLPPAYGELVGH
ncbi:hypothetical protein FB45DRAFT_926653 [Roridomyces roridus]|uniref:Mid2 domain-containing protein n=1 Tax=Roridomyces roridus TaxID=1738132 RepID=A0AAD7BKW2_9AGAR|nr:hypothetical protein FB45DRAFT_926653 [Roridomyces roridus]